VVVVLALVLAAAFGAADQYVGSLSAVPWATDLSLLSAPWLALAFVAGWTQRGAGRAALLGLGCTAAALAGYGLMTLSPAENAHLTMPTALASARSELPVLVGGAVSGPLFGWFGREWRTRRSWIGALATAAALSLEPLARVAAGASIRFRPISLGEAAAGVVLGVYVVARRAAPPGHPA
jgi:hypothetical protein